MAEQGSPTQDPDEHPLGWPDFNSDALLAAHARGGEAGLQDEMLRQQQIREAYAFGGNEAVKQVIAEGTQQAYAALKEDAFRGGDVPWYRYVGRRDAPSTSHQAPPQQPEQPRESPPPTAEQDTAAAAQRRGRAATSFAGFVRQYRENGGVFFQGPVTTASPRRGEATAQEPRVVRPEPQAPPREERRMGTQPTASRTPPERGHASNIHTGRTDAARPRRGGPEPERPTSGGPRERTTDTGPRRRPESSRRRSTAEHTREPNYINARTVRPDELWRDRDNGGRPMTPDLQEYVRVYQRVRNRTVDALQYENVYGSGARFAQFLKKLHSTPDLAENYNALNGDKRIDSSEVGKLRHEIEGRWGQPYNTRLSDPQEAVKVARMYGDSYGSSNRLERGQPRTTNQHFVRLPGIQRDYLPRDTVTYDERGRRVADNGYTFVYPPDVAIPMYMSQIARLGREIDAAIKDGTKDQDYVVDLIARQYQYGAAIRPFAQINNSLFVNLANAQMKLLGLNGLTHKHMDMVAQRIQPDSFARYFVDRVRIANGQPRAPQPTFTPRPDFKKMNDPSRRFGDTLVGQTVAWD